MSGHTPGPWAWFGNARHNEVYLATVHSGRRYVMGFQRWGMKGAQPMFQPADRGLVPAANLLKFEVGDKSVTGFEAAKSDDSVYRFDVCGIDCADASLIAAAPDLLAALEETWRVLRAAGLLNLTNGVQLGQTSWYVKICDAERMSDAAIAKAQPA